MAGIYLALQEKVSKEEARKLMMDYAPSAGEDVKRKLAKLRQREKGLPKQDHRRGGGKRHHVCLCLSHP